MDYTIETKKLWQTLEKATNEEQKIETRNKIVLYNIRLVPHVLRKYKPWTADQYQIGCIGLILATQTYNPTFNVPFANYACFCIERELQIEHKKKMKHLENQDTFQFIELDAPVSVHDDNKTFNYELISSPEAEEELNQLIEENELTFICNNIIKPSIKEIADTGRHLKNVVDLDKWEYLEFLYIMDLIFIDSQKQRVGLTQIAKSVNRSIQNIRIRHLRVMDLIFQRLWDYMNLSFKDLLTRLRGNHRIPKKLLCLDPGQTCGWAFFENGNLKTIGHLEKCFGENNNTINFLPLADLLNTFKPDFIVYEDYKIYSNKLNVHANSPVLTLRLIGAIEAYAQQHNIKIHKQMATTAKIFCTNTKLIQWKFWNSSVKHAMDAVRHGCYFLLFYKKGQHIV